jgi:two-component system chemotaxis response regulator CheY
MTEPAKRALVVDDATTVRMYHRGILEGAGFEVAEAMNGMEGLERALSAEVPPDLLLVDVNMPRMDGIPAIMISTEREVSDADTAFSAGANLFLVKPVLPDVLARCARALAGSGRDMSQ